MKYTLKQHILHFFLGFDGVEIHGAYGYLLDQFMKDSVNDKTHLWWLDAYFLLKLLRQILKIFCQKEL